MNNLTIGLAAVLLATGAQAGERIAGTNSYVLNQTHVPTDTGTFWMEDNRGTYQVTEGPLEPGFVQCMGSGFGTDTGSSGDGVCLFANGDDSFTWKWESHPFGPNTWTVVGSSGKYEGMRGSGTATTRIESKFRAMVHRITDWQGEITMPAQ